MLKKTAEIFSAAPFGFATIMFVNFLVGAINIANPYLAGKFLDGISARNYNILIEYVAVIAILQLTQAGVTRFLAVFSRTYVYKRSLFYSYRVIAKLRETDMDFFSSKNSVYISQRIMNDCSIVTGFFLSNSIAVVMNILTIIVCSLVTYKESNLSITLLLFLIIPLYSMPYIVYKKKLASSSGKLKNKTAKLLNVFEEQFSKLKFFRSNGFKRYSSERMNTAGSEAIKAVEENAAVSGNYQLFFGAIRITIMVTTFAVFGYYAVYGDGSVTAGDFIAFNSYAQMFFGTVGYFATLGADYQNALTSWQLMDEYENCDKIVNGTCRKSLERIELDEVMAFAGEKALFLIPAARFERGKIYRLAGRNGVGKTTLIDMILGLRRKCYSGRIYYDGIEQQRYDMEYARKEQIAFVEQEPPLLNATLHANIDPESRYCMEDVLKKTALLGVDNILAQRGLDYVVDERNSNLSGGEKQKLAIVRAALKKPCVMILDEPVSALDKTAVARVKKMLLDIKSGCITIIISHTGDFDDIADETLDLNKYASSCSKN